MYNGAMYGNTCTYVYIDIYAYTMCLCTPDPYSLAPQKRTRLHLPSGTGISRVRPTQTLSI